MLLHDNLNISKTTGSSPFPVMPGWLEEQVKTRYSLFRIILRSLL